MLIFRMWCGIISKVEWSQHHWKKGHHFTTHTKLKWLMKTFVISLAGDINLYFSQNIQTNNFFVSLLFTLITLAVDLAAVCRVCVCVWVRMDGLWIYECARISLSRFAIVLSFIAGILLNVMFFRLAGGTTFY